MADCGRSSRRFTDLRRAMEMAQTNTDYELATCAYCGGSGDIAANQCRAWGGQGSVLVAQPARECAHCQGKGKKSAYRCNFCQGTGWARALRSSTRWKPGAHNDNTKSHTGGLSM